MAITTPATSIDEVVRHYWRFLERNDYSVHLKRFAHRLKSDPDAARAEAVVFSILWEQDVHPDIFEDNSTGGADFCCKPTSAESFLVEVTSLNSAALSERSKLPERITGPGAGAFNLITEKLFSVVQGKNRDQLRSCGQPAVLAITCAYDYAALLMNGVAAQCALGSRPRYEVRGGRGRSGASLTWDPKGGIFWSPTVIVDSFTGLPYFQSRYQGVSAVLLVSIYRNEANVVALLHPDPTHTFETGWLPTIPYVRFKQWPPMNAQIELEWTREGCAVFPHRLIV